MKGKVWGSEIFHRTTLYVWVWRVVRVWQREFCQRKFWAKVITVVRTSLLVLPSHRWVWQYLSGPAARAKSQSECSDVGAGSAWERGRVGAWEPEWNKERAGPHFPSAPWSLLPRQRSAGQSQAALWPG